MTPTIAFLLGVIALADAVAAAFFLRFWKSTRDLLFAAFAAFFLLEAAERAALLFSAQPNVGSTWIHVFRLLGLLLILAAILRKNYGGRHP
ncbi:MAG: DUF5985 family protein [Candidatus Acidiferrales bacterium]